MANNTSEDAGSATSRVENEIVVVAKKPKKQIALDNPLHDYDSYTYCLSLHLLNPFEFDDLIADPSRNYVPKNVLVSSAGRYNTNFSRNPAFTEDFYFDNLKMSTYINIGHRNRNSNLLECSFTLIEPSGFTFINRLIEAANIVNRGMDGNYIKMPYVLQIDFFGYKDGVISGSPIPNLTKVMPINLIEVKSRVTNRGAEYAIRAVPYNHMAYSSDIAVSKADFLIKSKTVSDVFGAGTVSSSEAFAALEEIKNLERQESDITKLISQETDGPTLMVLSSQQSTIRSTLASKRSGQYQVTGFSDAINSWWAELQRRGETLTVNRIKVKFDETIGSASLIPTIDSPVSIQQAASGGTTQDQKSTMQSAGGQSKGGIDFNSVSMTVPAGTSILKLIDWSVRNSSYIGNQLKDPTAAVSLDPLANNADQLTAPLNWYRVVPEVMIDGYDKSTSSYTMSIVYHVTPWTVSSKHPMGPMGKADGYSKVYEYLYTGKNKDVLDMQIDFNLLYAVQMTSARNKNKTTQTAPVKGDEQQMRGEVDNNPNTATDVQSAAVVVPQSVLQPVPVTYHSNNLRYALRTGGEVAAAVTAGDISESLMVDSKGDMISLRLRILGDPHLIKQDDIFYNAATFQNPGQVTPNNSLWMDYGELYVFVNFKTPIDYNESIGLALPDSADTYTYSQWTGIYKIIKIDNEFNKGKFEQVLELARLPFSDADLSVGSNAQQRVDALKLINYGNAGRFAASRFTGPLVLQNNLASGLPAYNAPADALKSGASAIQSILSGALNKVVSDTVGALTKKVTDSVGTTVKNAVTPYTDSISAAYYEWRGEQLLADQMPSVSESPPLTDAEISDLFGDTSNIVVPEFDPPTDLGDFNG